MAHEALPSGAIIVPVGSRVTCNPPPMDTDEDYLLLVKDKEAAVKGLLSIGFEHSTDPKKVAEYEALNEASQWSFTSLYLGDVNYIVTESEFFFERFLTATHVCKTLNLLRKEDRVMVFDAIRGVSFFDKLVPDWKSEGNIRRIKKSGGLFLEEITDKLSDAAQLKVNQIIDPMPF